MIHYFVPYSLEGDLGKAYNNCAKLVQDPNDWICVIDADSMLGLTPKYGHILQDMVDKYPDTGLFTTYTNRVGNLEQCYNGIISSDSNILNHKKIAKELVIKNAGKVKEINRIISGMIMIFKKSVWEDVGGFHEDIGILAVDNKFSKRILRNGYKIRLIESVYLFHFYRLDTGRQDKSHLLR